jgi:hypothetical protein
MRISHLAIVVAAMASAPTMAITFVNTNGGDGSYVQNADFSFTVIGADNGVSGNYALLTDTAFFPQTYTTGWIYQTFDVDGSSFDPAGYYLNGVYTQLTANDQPYGSKQKGIFSIALNTGDVLGFYVNSTDGIFGRGQFTFNFDPASVPEPASWAMLIAGFGLAGAAARRRKAVVAA